MPPPGLDEADRRLVEGADGAAQKVNGGDEVRVKDRDQLGVGLSEPKRQGAGLETFARISPHMLHVHALPLPVNDPLARDLHRLVIRIVKDLNVQAFARPVDGANGIDHAFGDVSLVVDRDLDADVRFVVGSEPASGG